MQIEFSGIFDKLPKYILDGGGGGRSDGGRRSTGGGDSGGWWLNSERWLAGSSGWLWQIVINGEWL